MGDQHLLSWIEMKGRNGWEHPAAIPEDMGREAVNVVLVDGGLPKRRPGSITVPATGDAFDGVASLEKYVPPGGLAHASLILTSLNDAPLKMLSLTTAFVATNLTLADAITGLPSDTVAAQLNNKLFLAYKSGQNRLHVWDPVNLPATISRAGLGKSVAATVADTGAGTYAATQRWYEIQFKTKTSGGVVLRESELSPVVAFTPSGTGTAARVTKPANPGETETHWVVFASADSASGPFYNISGDIAIATTTYDDSAVPSTYNTNLLGPTAGSFLAFPSVRFLATDKTRLFGFGVHETSDVGGNSLAPVAGRVYYSPVLGALAADDERIESTVTTEGWKDLEPGGAGAEDRGIAGPMDGEMYVFLSKGIYRLMFTGQATNPIASKQMTPHVGAVSHKSIVMAEDENSAPAIYFLDPTDGPRRIVSRGGMQWLGRDVDDIWRTVNRDATIVKAFGEYDSTNKRILWWIATGSSNTPNAVIMFDVTHGETQGFIVRKGWVKWSGNISTWICGRMFPGSGGNLEALHGGGDHAVFARIGGCGSTDPTHDYGFASPPTGYQQAMGTYAGTGVAHHIAVGFQPDAIIIRPIDTNAWLGGTGKAGAFWTKDMAATKAVMWEGGTEIINLVNSVDATGFTVGTDNSVNGNSSPMTYQWIAFKDSTGTIFRTGTYVGNATKPTAIVAATGFKPTVLYILGNGEGAVTDDNMGANVSINLGWLPATTDYIISLDANGFTIGSDDLVNKLSMSYYYMAWKHDAGGLLNTTCLRRGSYAGTGAGVTVSGIGFTPQFVSQLNDSTLVGGHQGPCFATPTNGCHRWTDNVILTDGITSVVNGGFVVDAHLSVVGVTNFWHAFGLGGTVPVDNP